MLRLVDQVETCLEKCKHLTAERITNGASWGLYRITMETDVQPKTLLDEITRHLNNSQVSGEITKKGKKEKITITPWRHATWAVDIIKAGDSEKDFPGDREKAQALNRWRQMQSPTLTLLDLEKTKPTDQKDKICCIDLVRPALADRSTSAHVCARRQYGRWQKQDFYREETELPDLPKFVNDLYELTEIPDTGEGTINTLSGKMAVI